MHEIFRGTGVALITPFTDNYKIDLEAFGRILAHTGAHVDYWVINGTTGESVTTSASEKIALLDFAKEANERQIPIVYGLGGNNTHAILDEIESVDWSGIGAVLSVSPYYNKPSQAGIIKHYETVANATPVPLILYNVPGRTSANLTAETTLELAQHPNIIGIKEASGDLNQCMKIAASKPKDFLLISGDDMLTVPMISFGAVGVISVLANAYPAQFTKMVKVALDGNFTEASSLMLRFVAINDCMYREGNPTGVKEAMAQLELCTNQVRLPHLPATKALSEAIGKAADALSKENTASL